MMVEQKKLRLLSNKENMFKSVTPVADREGYPIEKGVSLSYDFLEKNEELLRKYTDFFIAYPDLFLDIIKQSDADCDLFFYQRIMSRAMMRYVDVNITAGRATAKSFLSIIALFLQCVFIPGRKVFIVAPYKSQASKIATQKLEELFAFWPLLRREVNGGDVSERPGTYGKDYVKQIMTYALAIG